MVIDFFQREARIAQRVEAIAIRVEAIAKSAGPGARRVLGSWAFVSSLLSYVLSVLVLPRADF